MSDRTQGSVRTGARVEDSPSARGASQDGGVPDGQQSAPSSTSSQPAATPAKQSPAPAAGGQRTPASSDGTAPVVGAPVTLGTGAPAAAPAAADVVAGPAAGTAPAGAGGAAPGAPATATSPPVAGQPAGGTAPGQGAGPGQAAGRPSSAPRGPGGNQKAARGPRRARLQLRHIDTWSALKISLVLSIALFFIWMVAVGVLYGVLSGLGVFDTLNDLFGQLGTASGADGSGEVITPGIVFGGAAVTGAINIVLLTALCTVAAFIYNMCSDLVGGLEVTLSERD